MVHELALECPKEAFDAGVVPAVAGAAAGDKEVAPDWMDRIFLFLSGASCVLPMWRSAVQTGCRSTPGLASRRQALGAVWSDCRMSSSAPRPGAGRFGWTLADAAVDDVFGETNNGVVPTAGSYDLNTLSRAVYFNRLGELRDRTCDAQRYRASVLNLVVAAIILWNTVYFDRAAWLPHLAPVHWDHINFTGDYSWRQNKRVGKGGFRPMRPPRNS